MPGEHCCGSCLHIVVMLLTQNMHVHVPTYNSAHAELLSILKEASSHRSTTGLFIQAQEADVLIIA